MKVDNTTTLSDIQKVFHDRYRHLRLEFYRSTHDTGEGSREGEKLAPSTIVKEISGNGIGRELTIDDNSTISDFEDHLSNEYGLNAQVFRRSGNLWLQTTRTDTWSLNEANRKGGHSQELFNEQSKT